MNSDIEGWISLFSFSSPLFAEFNEIILLAIFKLLMKECLWLSFNFSHEIWCNFYWLTKKWLTSIKIFGEGFYETFWKQWRNNWLERKYLQANQLNLVDFFFENILFSVLYDRVTLVMMINNSHKLHSINFGVKFEVKIFFFKKKKSDFIQKDCKSLISIQFLKFILI